MIYCKLFVFVFEIPGRNHSRVVENHREGSGIQTMLIIMNNYCMLRVPGFDNFIRTTLNTTLTYLYIYKY